MTWNSEEERRKEKWKIKPGNYEIQTQRRARLMNDR